MAAEPAPRIPAVLDSSKRRLDPGLHRLILLLVCLLAAELLTTNATIGISDAQAMLNVTISMLHGSIDVPARLGVPGVHGLHYSKYGLGWSLAALPPYAAGLMLSQLGYRHVDALPWILVAIMNPVLCALTGALVARFALRLGASFPVAAALAAVTTFATPLWPLAKDGYSEPLLVILLLAAGYLLRGRERLAPPRALLSGALLGGAFLTRPDSLPEIGLIWLYGFYPVPRRRQLGAAVWFATPLALALAVQLAYDDARFGSPFILGYNLDPADTDFRRTPLGILEGLGLLLVDPARGILWGAPVIVPAAAAVAFGVRRRDRFSLLAAGMLLVSWVEHANVLDHWQGGWSWGARFLVPALPFALLALARPLMEGGRSWRVAVGALALAGFANDGLAAIFGYGRYFAALDHGRVAGELPQLYLLRTVGPPEIWWYHFWPRHPLPVAVLVLALATALGGSAALLAPRLRQAGRGPEPAPG